MLHIYRKQFNGFSLAEAMIATAILVVAVAAVTAPFTSGAKLRAEGLHRTITAKLASDFMEKIINTPFDQIVGSFDGYNEPQGQVKNAAGVVFTDALYSGYSISSTCKYVYVPQQNLATQPNFILAAVRVYYRGSQMAAVNRLISR